MDTAHTVVHMQIFVHKDPVASQRHNTSYTEVDYTAAITILAKTSVWTSTAGKPPKKNLQKQLNIFPALAGHFINPVITPLTCIQRHPWAAVSERSCMYALIGAHDHSGEPQDWKKKKKQPQYLEKRKEERKSNIFSPNYSVGTVLCTVECPGSGVAWWVNAGAKPHPPHIVLSVDVLHAHLQDLCPPLTLLARMSCHDSLVPAPVVWCMRQSSLI